MNRTALWLATGLGLICLSASSDAAESPPAPEKGVCYELYRPVCATKDGKRATYSNACFATRDGASEINDGACAAGK